MRFSSKHRTATRVVVAVLICGGAITIVEAQVDLGRFGQTTAQGVGQQRRVQGPAGRAQVNTAAIQLPSPAHVVFVAGQQIE